MNIWCKYGHIHNYNVFFSVRDLLVAQHSVSKWEKKPLCTKILPYRQDPGLTAHPSMMLPVRAGSWL